MWSKATYISTCEIRNVRMATPRLYFIIRRLRITTCYFNNLEDMKKNGKDEGIRQDGSNEGKSSWRWEKATSVIHTTHILYNTRTLHNRIEYVSRRPEFDYSTYWMKSLQFGTGSREYRIGRHCSDIDTNRVMCIYDMHNKCFNDEYSIPNKLEICSRGREIVSSTMFATWCCYDVTSLLEERSEIHFLTFALSKITMIYFHGDS